MFRYKSTTRVPDALPRAHERLGFSKEPDAARDGRGRHWSGVARDPELEPLVVQCERVARGRVHERSANAARIEARAFATESARGGRVSIAAT
jgi:hypothetical protein